MDKRKRKAIIAAVLASVMGLSTAGCGNEKEENSNPLRYEYNQETNSEVLVGETDSFEDLYFTKITDYSDNPRCYITEYIYKYYLLWDEHNYKVLGTNIMIAPDNKYNSEVGNLVYCIPLDDVAYYYGKSRLKDKYTAEEINDLIEKVKNDEEILLENEYIKEKVYTPTDK